MGRKPGKTAAGDATRERVISAIRELTASQKRPPTQKELQVAAGLKRGGLLYQLEQLERDDRIERKPGARGIVLKDRVA